MRWNQCSIPCAVEANLGMGCPAPIAEYDGNPLFFPVDDLASDVSFIGNVPAQYGWSQWPNEEWVTGEAPMHNFSFTSEVTYWFRHDAAGQATLTFSGDDDVWVFVNGQFTGGYGQCGGNCKFDGYYGDGVLQEEYENCDDGNYSNDDLCPSSCRVIKPE